MIHIPYPRMRTVVSNYVRLNECQGQHAIGQIAHTSRTRHAEDQSTRHMHEVNREAEERPDMEQNTHPQREADDLKVSIELHCNSIPLVSVSGVLSIILAHALSL